MVLKRARRRDIIGKATAITTALRSGQLGQPPAIAAACAVTARSLIAVITTLNEQVKTPSSAPCGARLLDLARAGSRVGIIAE